MPHGREETADRIPGAPRRSFPGFPDPRARGPHLPDIELRLQKHPARGRPLRSKGHARLHLHPHRQPHDRCSGAAPGRDPQRHGRDLHGLGHVGYLLRRGGDHGGGAEHRLGVEPLRRDPCALREHFEALRDRGALRRFGRPQGGCGRDRRQDPPALHREHRQPQVQRGRLQGPRRGRPPAPDPLRRGQHRLAPADLQPLRPRLRHRGLLAHQDHRRPWQLDRRGRGGGGRIRLGRLREVPRDHRPRPELPRPQLLGGALLARRDPLHGLLREAAHGLDARHRRGPGADE